MPMSSATAHGHEAAGRSRRLGMLVRCCICFGCSVGLVNDCLGIFTTSIVADLSIGVGEFSIVMTLANIATAFTTLFVSRLLGRVPINVVMGAGSALVAASFAIMGSLTSIYQYYVAAAVMGVGISCFSTLPVTYVLQTWFGARNGVVTGIAMGCSGVIGAVANPVCSMLIESVGFRSGFRVIGLIFALLAFPAAVTMRTGDERFVKGSGKEPGSGSASNTSGFHVTVPLIALACCFTLMGCLGSHLSVFGQDMGYSLGFASLMVSAVMIANVVFKTVLGALADRIGAIRATVACIVICMAGYGLLTIARVAEPIALLAALLFGASSSLHTVGIALIAQRVSKERYAEVFSKVTMSVSMSYALFISLAGFVRDATGGYDVMLLLGMGAGICALLICASFERRLRLMAKQD